MPEHMSIDALQEGDVLEQLTYLLADADGTTITFHYVRVSSVSDGAIGFAYPGTDQVVTVPRDRILTLIPE